MGGPGDAAQGSVDPPKGLSMNQESNSPGPIPKTGLVISIQAKSKEAVAATVISHSSSEIRVKLARPRSQVPFRSGERVRIKYWDEGTVAYYWEAKVLEVDGDQEMAISIHDTGVAVQRRRSYRLALRVPFTMTVIDAADPALECGTTVRGRTENISIAGLLFETDLPLSIGDRVEINLQFTQSDQVSALGWVVRASPDQGKGESCSAIAVEFLQIDEEEQSQMLDFLVHYDRSDDG